MHTPVAARTLIAVALVLGAAAGCTTAPSPDDDLPAQRYVLEGTVDYLNMWSRQYLLDDLGSVPGPIPDDAWQRALRRAADGATKIHLGCASAEVTVGKDDTVGIRLKDCGYPGASASMRTLASAEGCLVLPAPTGGAGDFLQIGGGPSPPAFVESADRAGPSTWFVGPCP